MKKFMTMMALMLTIVTSAKGMTYTEARNEAVFLTDKMAYELRLSAEQYEAVYEINLDYMLTVSVRDDLFGTAWARRNSDLRYVLTVYQYEAYQDTNYFYRPIFWSNNRFTFRIYSMYTDRTRFYMTARPTSYSTYRGGRNVGASSYYANRDFNKPVNVRPAMTGKPKPTWRDVPANSRNENWRSQATHSNVGQPTTARTVSNTTTRTVTKTTTTVKSAPAPPKATENHGTSGAPGTTTKSKGSLGGRK